MHIPPKSTGAGKLLLMARRTMALLTARRPTVAFAAKLKGPTATLKKSQLGLNDAEDAAIEARAQLTTVQFDTLEFMTDLELMLFGLVRKDRSNPVYKAVFAEPMSVLKARSPDGCYSWLVKTDKYLTALPATRPEKVHAKAAHDLVAQWKAPKAALDELAAQEATAQSAVDTAREKWLDAYVSLHGALEAQYPRQRRFVESFFPVEKPAGKAKPAVTPPAVAGAASATKKDAA